MMGILSFFFAWQRTDASSQTVKYLHGTTVSSIALAWCDVVAGFPRDFDRVFLVTGAAEAPSSVTADSVDVTRKHG
jgi:hypothetical protein